MEEKYLTCSQCGKESNSDSKNCIDCGTQLIDSNENEASVKDKKDKNFMPFLVVLIGSLIMALALFLPYTSATEEFADVLEQYSDELFYEESEMSSQDTIDITLIEFANIYYHGSETLFDSASQKLFYKWFVVVVAGLLGLFPLLTLLSAALKKPIVIMIFAILAFATFNVLNWNFKDRGVMPNSNYIWGISYYMYYVAVAILLVGAIWMLVKKMKYNK